MGANNGDGPADNNVVSLEEARARRVNARNLDKVDDPWAYLNAVRELDLPDRPPTLNRWLELVQARPAMEREALQLQGREVWKYTMAAVRGAVRELDEVAEGVSQTKVNVSTDEFLAETVYNLGGFSSAMGYLVHQFDQPDAPPVWKEQVTVGKTVYYPPPVKMAELGVVLFPSGYEEPGSDLELFTDLRAFIGRYLQLDNEAFQALLCYYIMMTWVHDRFDALPYLRSQGDFGAGKTRLLQVVGSTCYRPIMAGGATTASPIFRIIDRYHGTLIVDEADFDRSEMWAEILKILNTGYQRGFPVLRAERSPNDAFDVAAYECYGPKLLSTRHRFADAALESRCLSYTMPLLELREDMPLVLGPRFRQEAQQLRNRLLVWRFRKFPQVDVDPLAKVPGAEPRVNQIIQPILACVGDAQLRQTILDSVLEYSLIVRRERAGSLEGLLLMAALQTWARKNRPVRLLLKDVMTTIKAENEGEPTVDRLSSRKAGDILNRVLKLRTEQVGGISWLYPEVETLKPLTARYGLKLEQYLTSPAVAAASLTPSTKPSGDGGPS